MRLAFFALALACLSSQVWAQSPGTFAYEYEFHRYLLREAYPDEALMVLQGLKNRPNLSVAQRDSVHHAIGRYHYQRQELAASSQAFLQVSQTQPELWRESVFFAAFNQTYGGDPQLGSQTLAAATFADPQFAELKAYELAGMALLQRDYEAYSEYQNQFTRGYFAFAEEEQRLGNYAEALQNYRPKKPWVAGGLSALVPGLGRVYAGKAGQGIATFFQVAVFALQAWEGYRLDGPKSWRFIGFGSIGGILYVSNIWGSAYAAKLRNDEFYEAVDNSLVVDLHLPLRTIFR